MVKDDSAFDVKVPIVSNPGMRVFEKLFRLQLAVLNRLSA
jgi:hypothetical protein